MPKHPNHLTTVKDLIKALKAYPDATKVCLALDDEGNSFAKIDMIAITEERADILVIWPSWQHHEDPKGTIHANTH